MTTSIKNFPLFFILLSLFSTPVLAQVNINTSRELRQCQRQLERQIQLVENVSERLRACRQRNTSPRPPRRDDLIRENQQLREENAQLRNEIYRLERVIDRLQRGPLPGEFDLAMSMRACSNIRNQHYENECIEAAKKYRVNAETINSCAQGISNDYYAYECVNNAGKYSTNEFQTRACVKISNSSYAAECVKDAGKNGVSEDVILACIDSTNNSYYQSQCVAKM